MIKLQDLLWESIDIYSPQDLADRGISYEIKQSSPKRFEVNLKYKDHHYSLRIRPLLNPKRPSINFGDTDENYEHLNLNKLLRVSYSPLILAAIFGLIRYWVDYYNIQEFEFAAESGVRLPLYLYYMSKHFSDFENTPEVYGEYSLQVWKKK